MGISYGHPESRLSHYKRSHLKFALEVLEIEPKDPKDSIHYVYLNTKLEGADQKCEENFGNIA
jgi:hypothetical protein